MTGQRRVWPARERYAGGDAAAGIESLHAFSFTGFYDPRNVGFGLLMACNEERLAPGAGFAEHAHRDTEIITWVIEGEVEHRADGTATRLRAGDAQLLSAGSGTRHVERNPGAGPARFLQMWLHPETVGGAPRHTAAAEPAPPGPGLHLIASAAPGAPLPLRNPHATLHLARGSTEIPQAPFVYLHVLRGTVHLPDATLSPGDALRATLPHPLPATATPTTEYLLCHMTSPPARP